MVFTLDTFLQPLFLHITKDSKTSKKHYKVIETSKKGTLMEMNPEAGRQVSSPDSFDRYEAHLTNLQRSTRYTAYVKAFNVKGKGPPSDPVIVKTLDDVPPTAPSLSLHSSSASSITISWSVLNSLRVTGVQKFILYYKKLNSNHDWREVPIHSPSMTHTIGNLECGTAYEFFMTAHNSVGKSEPSVPLVARSQGSIPSSPRSSEVFAKIAPTEAVINLSSWKASECLITDFSIRIRSKASFASRIIISSRCSFKGRLASLNFKTRVKFIIILFIIYVKFSVIVSIIFIRIILVNVFFVNNAFNVINVQSFHRQQQ